MLRRRAAVIIPSMRMLAVVGVAFVVAVAPAVASAHAPVVSPLHLVDATETTATLDATMANGGEPSTYRIEYGTSPAYGTSTPETVMPFGAGTERVVVSGLVRGTTYHVRLVATNASGQAPSADLTFATAGPPTALATTVASVTSGYAIVETGIVANRLQTSYHFEYGPTADYGLRTPERDAGRGSAVRDVLEWLTGLAPGTTYHYRVVLTNADGAAASADATFTTLRDVRFADVRLAAGPVVWGGWTTIVGRVVGNGSGGTTVSVLRPYPLPGPVMATTTTAADGSFSLRVGPFWRITRLRLSTPSSRRPATRDLNVRVRVAVALRRTRIGPRVYRLDGAVLPLLPDGLASLQRRVAGRWLRVARAGLKPAGRTRSNYSFVVRRAGLYRVVVVPNDGLEHLRGTSRERRIRR